MTCSFTSVTLVRWGGISCHLESHLSQAYLYFWWVPPPSVFTNALLSHWRQVGLAWVIRKKNCFEKFFFGAQEFFRLSLISHGRPGSCNSTQMYHSNANCVPKSGSIHHKFSSWKNYKIISTITIAWRSLPKNYVNIVAFYRNSCLHTGLIVWNVSVF